jgi:succinyl-CoA synthetase beta subunit
MRLIEADGKMLLRRCGLPVPHGRLHGADDAVEVPAGGAAVKAQIFAGARAKHGFVQLTAEPDVRDVFAEMAERMRAAGLAPHILVEEKIAIETECYLAWRIDDVRQAPVMLFSPRGGVEVEEQERVHELLWDPLAPLYPFHLMQFLLDAGAPPRGVGALARFAAELYRLFLAEDAQLIEINPVGVTAKGQVVALDVKAVLDDNARFRHQDWSEWLSARLERSSITPLEASAADRRLTLVELDGCVALFAGGAGFGMALVDLLGDAGIPAANFADASGGTSPGAFAAMGDVIMARAAAPDVKAIVCFQVMGATSLKGAVEGMLAAWDRAPVKKPLVTGFAVGAIAEREMTGEEARALCRARGHHVIAELDELIPALRRIVDS